MKRLISAHFTSPVPFSRRECMLIRKSINFSDWSDSNDNYTFLSALDNSLLKLGIVPKDPLKNVRSSSHQD